MAGNTNNIEVKGNLTNDPELRYTPNKSAVVNFNVAQTSRKFDRQTNQWVDDGPTNFFRCTAWNRLAENIAESLKKGDPVGLWGTLGTEEYTDKKTGETRKSTNNVDVDFIGPNLAFATATVSRNQRSSGDSGGNYGGNQGGYGGGYDNNQGNQGGGNYGGNQGGYGGGYDNNQGNQGGGWDAPSEPPF